MATKKKETRKKYIENERTHRQTIFEQEFKGCCRKFLSYMLKYAKEHEHTGSANITL